MADAFIGRSKNKRFLYSLENLKKHFFAFGSSGSGKTVLSKAIIEEAALNGIPSIIIDLQGDLSSLAISGKEEDIKKHGLDPSVLEKFRDNVNVTIFTPISAKGIPVCINPLKFDFDKTDPEETIPLISEIAESIVKFLGYDFGNDKGKAASAVLYTIIKHFFDNKKNIDTFSNLVNILNSVKQAYGKDHGKSKLSGIVEEVKQFYPESKDLDELVRKVKFLTVGQKELLFQFGVPLDIGILLGKKVSPEKAQVSIIYLNTLQSAKDKEFFITVLCTSLYQWMLRNPKSSLQGIFYIDEVAPYMPAGSEKPMPKPMLMLLLKQARKYGIGMLIATQNPGDIDYKAFAQFGTWAIGRLTVKQDQKKIEKALASLTGSDISKNMPKLRPGNFLLFTPDISKSIVDLDVRWLYTEHKTLNDIEVKEITDGSKRELYDRFMLKGKRHLAGENAETGSRQQAASSGEESQTISKAAAWEANRPAKDEEKDDDFVLHFPLNIEEDGVRKIIRSNIKRSVLFRPKERVSMLKLSMLPLYKLSVAARRKALFRKGEIELYTLFVSATTGEIISFNKWNKADYLTGFSKLVGLNYNQLKIIRYLFESATDKTAVEISIKLGITQSAVTRSLKLMKQKRIVSNRMHGRNALWFSILAKDKVADSIKDAATVDQQLSKNSLNANIMKTKLKLKAVEDMISNWFEGSNIADNETIYMPIYHIGFIGKKSSRNLIINGYTTKIINN